MHQVQTIVQTVVELQFADQSSFINNEIPLTLLSSRKRLKITASLAHRLRLAIKQSNRADSITKQYLTNKETNKQQTKAFHTFFQLQTNQNTNQNTYSNSTNGNLEIKLQ